MLTVLELFRELELTLSDVGFTGLRHVQPLTLDRFRELARWMEELGMPSGVRRIDALVGAIQSSQLGQSDPAEAVNALCALDFYCKNVLGRLANADGDHDGEADDR